MKRGNNIILLLLVFLFLMQLQIRQEVQAAADSVTGYHLELGERLLKKGDEGADVALLQQKLRDLDLYRGPVDGVFGAKTEQAVKLFQQKNELKVDGIAGRMTLKQLPADDLASRKDISREEYIMLARIISGEARGESFRGKVAVGAVILNRVESKKFPDSIKKVILQEGQFSSRDDGQAILYPTNSSLAAARAALLGYDPTRGALFFYNPQVATNLRWISSRPVLTRIGGHLFAS